MFSGSSRSRQAGRQADKIELSLEGEGKEEQSEDRQKSTQRKREEGII